MIRSRIIGCGAYLPENIVSNDEIAKIVDTSDAWIRDRTGIRERRIVRDGEKTSDLALAAARAALMDAGIDAGEIDIIICCTTTPDRTAARFLLCPVPASASLRRHQPTTC